ncbi:hypothetical protein L596_021143 [Steinernema carpocapsae]|uniref:Paired domain-containing protein n=1 Tax=Steinernema carpocapsae TaxID=34508 RepID=A0A4V6A138_STECR|nr:hypothetical protein L596_021143 [Steinernema carpocapsae]
MPIAKLLKFPRVQVHRIVQRFQEAGKIKDRQRSERPRCARTPELKKKVKRKIKRNSERNIAKLAREHEFGYATM